MKSTLFAELSLFSLAARAWRPEGHDWHPPLPEDSRSPCPGLNILANHGYLPRSGKDIDLEAVRYGVSAAYNFERTVFDGAFQEAVDFKLTTTGNSSTFDLADLAVHDEIEMDGSQSRNDLYFGDNLHFDHAIWMTVAERLGLYDFGELGVEQYVTVEIAAKARAARVADAKRVNPTFNASAAQKLGSPGTTALYLLTLWDDKVGAVPKSWIRAFFEDERIPWIEGYKLSEKQKTGQDLADMAKRVMAVNVSSESI